MTAIGFALTIIGVLLAAKFADPRSRTFSVMEKIAALFLIPGLLLLGSGIMAWVVAWLWRVAP